MSKGTSKAGDKPGKPLPPAAPSEPNPSGDGKPKAAGRPPVPWNPWLGIVYVVLIYYASQIVAGLLLSVYPAFKHWSHPTTLDWVSNSVWAQFFFILMAEAFTLAAIYFFLWRYKAGFSSISLKRPKWSDPFLGLAAIPVYFILYLLAVNVITHFDPSLNVNQQQEIGFNGVQGGLQLTLAFISLVILPAVTEEIMVRGFLYSSMKKAMPTVYAVIFTSALFASAHLPEGGPSGPLYIAAIDTFTLSLVLIYLREATGNLWASMTLHAAKNTIAFVSLFALHLR